MYDERNLDYSQVILDDNHEIMAVCSYFDTLCIASQTTCSVYSVELSPNEVRVAGSTTLLCTFPDQVNTISNILLHGQSIFIAVPGDNGGIYAGKIINGYM